MSGGGSHPCTVMAAQRGPAERTADFLRAQEKVSGVMEQFPGFFGKELIRPVPGSQDEWVSVFRFSSTESLQRWMGSAERRGMIGELDACAEGEGSWQVVAGDDEETPPLHFTALAQGPDSRRQNFQVGHAAELVGLAGDERLAVD